MYERIPIDGSKRSERAGEELTDAVVERAREAGLDVHVEVLRGEPADELTEYARTTWISLGSALAGAARSGSSCRAAFEDRTRSSNRSETRRASDDVAGTGSRHTSTPVMLVRPGQ